jgi:hypothetical protein
MLIATISTLAVRNANAEFVKALEPTPSEKANQRKARTNSFRIRA